MEDSLLRATQKFLGQLGMEGYSDEHSWIDFKEFAESDEADCGVSIEATKSSAASVIGFDEVTGAQLNHQLQFLEAPKETNERIALPWREWHRIALASDLGAMAADKDSAVAVLHGLHENFDVVSQKIDVFYEDRRQFVVTTTKVPAMEIMLPPCVPKLMKVVETTDHPYAVILTERVMTGSEEALKLGLSPLLRERRFFCCQSSSSLRKRREFLLTRNVIYRWLLSGSGTKVARTRCTRFGLCGG
jgi:hypothetical protein